jgi:hypothetical protein
VIENWSIRDFSAGPVNLIWIAIQLAVGLWVTVAGMLSSFGRKNVEAVVWAGAGAAPAAFVGWLVYALKHHQPHAKFGAVYFVTSGLVSFIASLLGYYLVRQAPRRGHCAKCGYDRRGLAVGVACPECGTAPTK